MLLKDIFKDIHKGIAIDKFGRYPEVEIYGLDSADISDSVISTPKTETEIVKINLPDKHLLHVGDIVIGSVPSSNTSHVAYASSLPEYPVLLKKNIIVLRDLKAEYNPIFIAEYLENIGIKKLYQNGKLLQSSSLTVDLIKEIDIPNIPIEEQDKLVELFKPLNERTKLYKELLENDSYIKKNLLEEVMKYDRS